MRELKSFESERIYWAVEQVEREAGDIDNLHLDDNLFYLKSEADKVIADKDKEIAELKKQVHDYAQCLYVIQARAEKEARHHKYKRCMAMVERCKDKIENVVQYNEHDDWLIINEYWERWHERWLKIAEQFKESK